MPLKRASTSEAPAMTQAAIRKLVADSVTAALEAQAATMATFMEGLTRSIEGNVTASKPQTLEEATNIAQRLMDQILKHNSVQEANDRKRKFEDRRNTINSNNYANNSYNSDYPNNLDNNNHPNNHNDNRNS
ncbi:hypothetical protein Tco_1182174 [Tanacetum coccineum]